MRVRGEGARCPKNSTLALGFEASGLVTLGSAFYQTWTQHVVRPSGTGKSGGHDSRPIKANFHYAILVVDRSEAVRRPVADLLARASSLPAS